MLLIYEPSTRRVVEESVRQFPRVPLFSRLMFPSCADLAAIADHCLNSEPPVESSGTGNSSTGRYSGTFNVNTASVLPRQSRRVSSTSVKSQSRAPTPTKIIPAPPKLLLDPVKSANVILEIIETEKSYVRGLVELSELYIIPTAVVISVVDPATGETREESFISEDERDVVFGNIVSPSITSSYSGPSIC